jgi:hypothetical protein
MIHQLPILHAGFETLCTWERRLEEGMWRMMYDVRLGTAMIGSRWNNCMRSAFRHQIDVWHSNTTDRELIRR